MEANANFTSGMIMARNNEQKMPRYFVRGKFDMRARLPVATGIWTTFWLYGGGDNQIEGSEIDMLEYAPCKSSLRRMPWHLHGFHRGADYQDHRYIGNKYRLDDPGDWHVYTTEWDRHFIRFYVDGELKDVVSRFESGCIPDPDTEFPADRREVFPRVDEGMKLLATFDYTDDLYSRSLAGICLPIPRWLSDRNKVDARQPERHFIIDYIRVYQRADQLQRF